MKTPLFLRVAEHILAIIGLITVLYWVLYWAHIGLTAPSKETLINISKWMGTIWGVCLLLFLLARLSRGWKWKRNWAELTAYSGWDFWGSLIMLAPAALGFNLWHDRLQPWIKKRKQKGAPQQLIV